MKTGGDLQAALQRIDGKGYKAYKGIAGEYRFDGYRLLVDHVQGDPFAAPSRVRIRVNRAVAGFPPDTTDGISRTVALNDFLTRRFFAACRQLARGRRGTGKSGLITIDEPVQEILARSAMRVTDGVVEARFFMGLPAVGRGISGRDAHAMFFQELPRIVAAALVLENLDRSELYRHLKTAEDADRLRDQLGGRQLVGFVADGASLPRASGIDARPLAGKQSILFRSPDELRTRIHLPNRGEVSGMGIPEGVTLIVGGGFHGKSTLLNALELGIYNHIPGDGRELVVARPRAVKIRAADGRHVEKTDISPFINNLPMKKDTRAFSTANASGSTSQAANIAEAIETGAEVLLLDEDTSATNFMIRDLRMQRLVAKDKEPITPFVDKVGQLYAERGISTVLVMGGSGDYFPVADRIIQMTDYLPCDVTRRAHEIAAACETARVNEGGSAFGDIRRRIPLVEAFNPHRENHRVKIGAPRQNEILFGRSIVDLGDVEQLVDISQTRAMGFAIAYATRFMDGRRTLREIVDLVVRDIDEGGLDILPPYLMGDLACFRGIDLAAAINRMRTLTVKQIAT